MVENIERFLRGVAREYPWAAEGAEELRAHARKLGNERRLPQTVADESMLATDELYVHPFFTFDRSRKCLIIEEKEVKLTRMEVSLLSALVDRPNKLISYSRLVDELWQGTDVVLYSGALKVHVHRVRHKILHGREGLPDPIESVGGFGYKLYDPSRLPHPNSSR